MVIAYIRQLDHIDGGGNDVLHVVVAGVQGAMCASPPRFKSDLA